MRLWWRLIGFGFRLLYNELAFTYDIVSAIVSLGAWHCWQRAALDHLAAPSSSVRVLDLAHGTGTLQLDLHTRGYAVVGYDLSPAMGRITQKKLRKNNLAPNNLVCGLAQQLPFADNSFDAVISTFPTNFIVAPETLREIYRILMPHGQLIIVSTAKLTGGGPIGTFLEWLYRITGQRGDSGFDFVAYLAQFGFTAQPHHATCPRSEVTVIIARIVQTTQD
ncbi:MAG: methyltransferase domain-containing protein [Chloroflexi bacterium]|nr:MAG: class I SAM-dependent methyltransferase [Phototrophicales bacterium]RMF76330.1 MAG: methyltransferase domain-containing protein [Chloroflexota bacterium]